MEPLDPLAFPGPLRTERLTLRLMTPEDADAVHAYQGDPAVCRFLPYEPRSRDEVAALLADRANQPGAALLTADGDHWQVAVEAPVGGTASVVGEIFFGLRSVANRTGEIGWVFHDTGRGQGYATEAAAAVLALAFDTGRLHRVFARLDPANVGSVAVCRRLGMRHEALFHQDVWFKGGWGDTSVYALLAEEWGER